MKPTNLQKWKYRIYYNSVGTYIGNPGETKLPYFESGQARDDASTYRNASDNVQSGRTKCRYIGSNRLSIQHWWNTKIKLLSSEVEGDLTHCHFILIRFHMRLKLDFHGQKLYVCH
jgi:hypothetical protein